MILLLAVLLLAGAGALAVWRSRRLPADRVASTLSIAAVCLAPFALAMVILLASREQLDDLHVQYAGKRLAFDPETPLTIGGAAGGSEAAEDLHHELLGPRAGRIEVADAKVAETLDGVAIGDPVLRLASPAPMVSVDGAVINRFRLEDGDRIRFSGVEPPIEIDVRGSSLVRGERSLELGGRLASLLKGA